MSHVFILESHPQTQRWLSQAAQAALPSAPAHCFNSVSHGLQWLHQQKPLIGVVDLALPDGSGIACIQAIKAIDADIPVVVITDLIDDQHLLAALTAGADGYLLKMASIVEVVAAIHAVLDKRPALSPPVTRRLMQIAQQRKPIPSNPECPLTAREQRVLMAIAKGYKTADVATLLSISPHTAAKHVKNIYTKLAIHNRAEAIIEALRFGLIDKDTLFRG